MSKDFEIHSRTQSIGEEIANSVSHGVGLMGAIAALPILMVVAVKRGDTAGIVGADVFGATMIAFLIEALDNTMVDGQDIEEKLHLSMDMAQPDKFK